MQDFYSVYVLAYCSGHYTVDDYGGHRTITNCSRTSATFAFDPDKVFTLRRGFNTSDVFWPQSIRDDFAVIQSASKAMAIIYIIGVHATGITSLISILQTQYKARASVIAHLAFITVSLFFFLFVSSFVFIRRIEVAECDTMVQLSFVSLGVASSVASILSVKFVELINRHGQGSGISATTGHKFLGMTWSAVGLLFLTVVITVVTLPSDGVPKKSPAVAVEKKAEAEAEHA